MLQTEIANHHSGMVVPTFDPSTPGVKEFRSLSLSSTWSTKQVSEQPGWLHRETLSQQAAIIVWVIHSQFLIFTVFSLTCVTWTMVKIIPLLALRFYVFLLMNTGIFLVWPYVWIWGCVFPCLGVPFRVVCLSASLWLELGVRITIAISLVDSQFPVCPPHALFLNPSSLCKFFFFLITFTFELIR